MAALKPDLLNRQVRGKLLTFHELAHLEDYTSEMFETVQQFGSTFYFESRLVGENTQQLDLLVCVNRRNAKALLLWLQEAQPATPELSWFTALLEEWIHPSDPLRDFLSAIWLEWDGFRTPDSLFGVSLTLSPTAYNNPTRLQAQFVRLLSYSSPHIRQSLARYFEAVTSTSEAMAASESGCEFNPEQAVATPLHFSLMLQRKSLDSKFYTKVNRNNWKALFARFGWEAAIDNFASQLETVFPQSVFDGDLFFDIDLADMSRKGPSRTSLNWSLNPYLSEQAQRKKWLAVWEKSGQCQDELLKLEQQWNALELPVAEDLAFPFRQSRWLELKWVFRNGQWDELKAYWAFTAPRRQLATRA